MIYIFCRFLCWLLCRVLLRAKITGKKFIPKKDGCIIASNHISFLDPPLVGSSVNRPTYFMGKKELFDHEIFGNFMLLVHTFPVKRDEPNHAAISKAVKLLKQGKALVLFPEGGRNIDGSKESLLGIGFLAQLANVPIVPALVVDTDKALPHGAKFIKLHKIEIYFGQPIFPEEFIHLGLRRKELYKAITQKVMGKINELKK